MLTNLTCVIMIYDLQFSESVNAWRNGATTRVPSLIIMTIIIMTMKTIVLDPYFVDVLMPDLAGHERSPAAFLVYLYLWRKQSTTSKEAVQASYATIALETGLARITAQRAVALLIRRKLLSVRRPHATSTPHYSVARPWIGRLRT